MRSTRRTARLGQARFVWSIWLVSFNQTPEPDRTDQIDRIDQTDHMNKTGWRTFNYSIKKTGLEGEAQVPFGSRSHKNSGSLCCLAIHRAKTNNASLRRFRNRTSAGSRGSSLPNRTQRRSARRQIVLAWCNKLEIFLPPGRINSFRGGKSFCNYP